MAPKPKDNKPKLDAQGKPVVKGAQAIAQRFGEMYSIMEQDPALKSWFLDFAKRYTESKGQISQDVFNLELNQQDWWKNNSATYIQDVRDELKDPTGYNQRLGNDIARLRDIASRYGVLLDDDSLRELAISERRLGWNESMLYDELDKRMPEGVDRFLGMTGQSQDSLSQWALKNGISLTQNTIQDYARRISRGDTTIDDVKADLRKTYMAGAYPAWADRINSGQDIADIAAPYRSRMAKLLEMDEESIDFNDMTLAKGLQGVGADGKPGVVPLYDFDKMVRKDPRWDRTENALKTYTDVGTNLLKMFGFR